MEQRTKKQQLDDAERQLQYHVDVEKLGQRCQRHFFRDMKLTGFTVRTAAANINGIVRKVIRPFEGVTANEDDDDDEYNDYAKALSNVLMEEMFTNRELVRWTFKIVVETYNSTRSARTPPAAYLGITSWVSFEDLPPGVRSYIFWEATRQSGIPMTRVLRRPFDASIDWTGFPPSDGFARYTIALVAIGGAAIWDTADRTQSGPHGCPAVDLDAITAVAQSVPERHYRSRMPADQFPVPA